MPEFQCNSCSRQFKELTHLTQHQQASHGMTNSSSPEVIPCDYCNKTFTSPVAMQQHIDASHKDVKGATAPEVTTGSSMTGGLKRPLSVTSAGHKPFGCPICQRSFQSSEILNQHIRDKHSNEDIKRLNIPVASPGKVLCLTCNRSFSTDDARQQHTLVNHPGTLSPTELSALKKRKPFPCPNCTDSFDTEAARLQHISQKHDDMVDSFGQLTISPGQGEVGNAQRRYFCTTCYKPFDTKISALQHLEVKKDHTIKPATRKLAVDCFFNAARVETADSKKSVELFRGILKNIIDNVRSKSGGQIYSPNVRKAGSTAVNVKIGKADEFDTNIPLNINVKRLITDGDLDYIYQDKIDEVQGQKSKVNMNVDRTLMKCNSRRIPEGQAVVKVQDGSVPANLVYGEDLIPHKCVNLSREAHGPAITLTIVPSDGHYISVDLTLSLACSLKLSHYGWPRENTRRALKADKIEECLGAPIHLVPKGGDTWSISFSQVEETLLNGIDSGNECRRHVMQIMKRHLQICSSASRKGLEGISSYIIKQQLMWSAENHTGSGYWQQTNMDKCVIDVMADFIDTLKKGMLPNYFKPSVNILEHKRRDVLNILVRYFEEEMNKLIEME